MTRRVTDPVHRDHLSLSDQLLSVLAAEGTDMIGNERRSVIEVSRYGELQWCHCDSHGVTATATVSLREPQCHCDSHSGIATATVSLR
jgi:hypothetical protein